MKKTILTLAMLLSACGPLEKTNDFSNRSSTETNNTTVIYDNDVITMLRYDYFYLGCVTALADVGSHSDVEATCEIKANELMKELNSEESAE